MRTGRVLQLVFGALAVIVALGLLAGGGVTLWAHQTQRDADGFFTSKEVTFETGTAAVVSNRLDVANLGDWPFDSGVFADVRITATAADPTQPIFIGIGPGDAVRDDLGPAPSAEVTDVDLGGETRDVTYPGLGRWLWLVKWIIEIPHYVVLTSSGSPSSS